MPEGKKDNPPTPDTDLLQDRMRKLKQRVSKVAATESGFYGEVVASAPEPATISQEPQTPAELPAVEEPVAEVVEEVVPVQAPEPALPPQLPEPLPVEDVPTAQASLAEPAPVVEDVAPSDDQEVADEPPVADESAPEVDPEPVAPADEEVVADEPDVPEEVPVDSEPVQSFLPVPAQPEPEPVVESKGPETPTFNEQWAWANTAQLVGAWIESELPRQLEQQLASQPVAMKLEGMKSIESDTWRQFDANMVSVTVPYHLSTPLLNEPLQGGVQRDGMVTVLISQPSAKQLIGEETKDALDLMTAKGWGYWSFRGKGDKVAQRTQQLLQPLLVSMGEKASQSTRVEPGTFTTMRGRNKLPEAGMVFKLKVTVGQPAADLKSLLGQLDIYVAIDKTIIDLLGTIEPVQPEEAQEVVGPSDSIAEVDSAAGAFATEFALHFGEAIPAQAVAALESFLAAPFVAGAGRTLEWLATHPQKDKVLEKYLGLAKSYQDIRDNLLQAQTIVRERLATAAPGSSDEALYTKASELIDQQLGDL